MKLLLFSLCVLAALTVTTSVQAATRTVTKTDDTADGVCDADCSLREAFAAAVSGDTITFASPLFDTPQTITLTLGAEIAAVLKNLTIAGPGADKLTIDGGAGTNRIFLFNSSTINLSGLKLTGGNGAGASLSGYGGAVLALNGSVSISRVDVTQNSASRGGGVYIFGGSGHSISDSTFSANSAENGSGVFIQSSVEVPVRRSTFSGNNADYGTIHQDGNGRVRVEHCTITKNTGYFYGGIYATKAVTLRNSIVAGNSGFYPDIAQSAGQVTSEGYNLVGDSAGDSTSTLNPVTYHATDILDTDPQLGTLAYNVGTTPVHTPAAASPVIDKGNAFGQTTDQRGSIRTYDNPSVSNAAGGDGTDIGSVELQVALAADVSLAGKVTNALGEPIRAAEISVQGSDGVVRRTLTSQFGYYRITGLEAGGTYFISVKAKRYTFANPIQAVTAGDNLTGIDFTAAP